MKNQVIFPNRFLPYLLVLPQILITFIFFLWPSWQALEQSFFIEDAFGFSRQFVFLDNYLELISDESYQKSFYTTFVFSSLVVFFTMFIGLLFAVAANRVIRSALMYRSTLILPYAVAPALAGVLWYFLMNPSVGIVAYWLSFLNIDWNHYVNGGQAMILVIVASIWRQISYTFLFFVAALQSIPRSLIEAAAIDGSGPFKRFWTITFPLLSPTTFFQLVNL